MNFNDLLNVVQKGGWTGYVALAFAFFYALFRGILRFRREVIDQLEERDKKYEEMKADRDYWKAQATSTVEALERLTGIMEAGQNRRAVGR